MHTYFVYIMTNKANTILYVGVTNNLKRRIMEHKTKACGGFTANHNCNKLVYYDFYQWIKDAIAREKQIKGGSRFKKINLINSINPDWQDLFPRLIASEAKHCFVVPPRNDTEL